MPNFFKGNESTKDLLRVAINMLKADAEVHAHSENCGCYRCDWIRHSENALKRESNAGNYKPQESC
jgi:hypothetical protein